VVATYQMRLGTLIGDFRLHQKAVAFPGNSLDIERFVGRIAERLAELVYRGIYIGVVIDVRVGGPEANAQFLAGNHFSWLFEEREKNLIDLTLEFKPGTIAGDFLALLINPERPKMDITARRQENPLRSRRCIRFSHGDHFR
jgi:hypothetical protein